MEKALRALTDRFAGQGPVLLLEVDGDLIDLPAAVEVVVYRVVAEALTNVAKHAHADTATILTRRDERHLEVRVCDDGTGLTPRPDASGVGMSSMHSRAEELGGRCDIRSDRSGTAVELLLPLGS